MVGGGLLWGFDVGGMEDLRGRVGRRRGERERGEGDGEGERREEEEFERWVGGMVGREGGGEKRRWSAREDDDRGEEEAQATNGRGKPR